MHIGPARGHIANSVALKNHGIWQIVNEFYSTPQPKKHLLRKNTDQTMTSLSNTHIHTHTGQYAAALLLQEQSYKRKQTLAILILKFVNTCYKFLL